MMIPREAGRPYLPSCPPERVVTSLRRLGIEPDRLTGSEVFA